MGMQVIPTRFSFIKKNQTERKFEKNILFQNWMMSFEDSWIKKMMTNKSKNPFNQHHNIYSWTFPPKKRTDGGNGFLNKAFQKKGKQKNENDSNV